MQAVKAAQSAVTCRKTNKNTTIRKQHNLGELDFCEEPTGKLDYGMEFEENRQGHTPNKLEERVLSP